MNVCTSFKAQAETLVYDFDDGTFQGWQLITPAGDPLPADNPVTWVPSKEVIELTDEFDLLSATSGDYRIVPYPWDKRNCLFDDCAVQILRSPAFFLDGTGNLTIDLMGGAAVGAREFQAGNDFEPLHDMDFEEFKSGRCCQGFALRDVATGEYVQHGFSLAGNDGRALPSDPPERGQWETVTLAQEQIADLANNGRKYTIDIFDSFRGGWGWLGFDTVTIPGYTAVTQLQPGDADQDFDFDQLDLVAVQVAAKYLTGQAATWGEGDWDAAPGGQLGSPPLGDGVFNQLDLVAALRENLYLTGPYAARRSTAEMQTIPEPGSIYLVTLAIIGLLTVLGRKWM